MRRFRSTLQALLSVRQRQERLAMERYSGALQARLKAQEALTSAEAETRAVAQAMTGRLSGGMVAADLLHEHAHYKAIEAKRVSAQQAFAIAERAVEPALHGMLHARRQREVVEECISRQRERHTRDQMSQERKLMDELALRRAAPARAMAA